ncbi:MAG: transglutaminase-like domain-containing protein [Anaerolineae bacterium]
MSAQDFFATPGPMTDPGDMGYLLDNLPTDIADLVRVVQGLVLHIFWADQYGVQLAPDRREEVQLRYVHSQLARILELDASQLTEARPPESRLVGNCRDFSVLLTTMLRRQGVPARARCGFGRYFLPDHFEDHWVCEYWNKAHGRWVLVDAQLDALQREVLRLPFDPLDVPRDQFIVGGKAWQMCRDGEAAPDAFGIADMHGLWFVQSDFIRDVASLNKMELLPWDVWGLMPAPDEENSAEDLVFLDELAALTAGDVPDFERVRGLYEQDGRLRVPEVIYSFVDGVPRKVLLSSAMTEEART